MLTDALADIKLVPWILAVNLWITDMYDEVVVLICVVIFNFRILELLNHVDYVLSSNIFRLNGFIYLDIHFLTGTSLYLHCFIDVNVPITIKQLFNCINLHIVILWICINPTKIWKKLI